jgi:hypothetical protein
MVPKLSYTLQISAVIRLFKYPPLFGMSTTKPHIAYKYTRPSALVITRFWTKRLKD